MEFTEIIKEIFGLLKKVLHVLKMFGVVKPSEASEIKAEKVLKDIKKTYEEFSKVMEEEKDKKTKKPSAPPEAIKVLSVSKNTPLHILDLITKQVLVQKDGASELKELNIIHPEYQDYILTFGTAYASELTEAKVKKLAKKSYKAAKKYVLEALQGMWKGASRELIEKEGQVVDNVRFAKLDELFRSTIWADRSYSASWLKSHRIKDEELKNFMLFLVDGTPLGKDE